MADDRPGKTPSQKSRAPWFLLPVLCVPSDKTPGGIVRETGWYETLAAAVLNGLENALRAEQPMGQAMKDAYEKSAEVVADIFQFAKDHPVFCAVVALGILVIFAPWAVEVLGFGELGPIEGMFVRL